MLLRSALYTPGSRQKAIAKGRGLDADCLIFDLEDAVAPNAKLEARRIVLEELKKGGYGEKTIVVRVNSLDTEWAADDLQAVGQYADEVRQHSTTGDFGPHPLAAVVLAKAESASDILRCIEMLKCDAELPVWAMIETPRGVLSADAIASSHPRLRCLVAGTSDLTKDLQAQHTIDRAPLLFSLSAIVLAARANGIFALDGPHLDLADNSGFVSSCVQSRQFGFDGKTLIHPKTVALANTTFAPSKQEIEKAQKIIEAHAAAEARGEGITVVDGKLVENLHVENARRIWALADAIALKEEAAEKWGSLYDPVA